MSVLIKGMEMPEDCNECRFNVDGWCYVLRPESEEERKRITTNYCPLVEVPPHGRLIDADDFEKRIKMWTDHPNDYIRQRNQDMLYYVQQEATVIEAEEGEE